VLWPAAAVRYRTLLLIMVNRRISAASAACIGWSLPHTVRSA